MSAGTASEIAQANADLAAVVAFALVDGGVTNAVVSPGSRNTPLVLALDATLNTHVVIDERAAAFVALGLARATNRPVALCCTSGSAGAHYLPAIIEARYGGGGLVVITADRPAELQGCSAPQTIEQENLFGEQVRSSETVDADVVRRAGTNFVTRVMAKSIAAANDGQPVHINTRFAKPLWLPELTARAPQSPSPRIISPTAIAPWHVQALADRLKRAERGAVVCGPSHDPGAALAARELASRLAWPLLAEPTSGARHKDSITAYDAVLRHGGPRADLVLRVGAPPTSAALAAWTGQSPNVVIHPSQDWSDPSGAAETMVKAPAAPLLRQLAEGADGRAGEWLGTWQRANRVARDVIDTIDSQPLWEGGVARTVVGALNGLSSVELSSLQVGNSMPARDLDTWLDATPHVFSSRGAAGIDGGIATASGVALGLNQRCVFLGGELSLLHDVGGLLAARGLDSKLAVVIIRNGGGGIFRHLPIHNHPTAFDRYFLTPPELDIEPLARAAKAAYVCAETLDTLRGSINSARRVVIEVPVDPTHDLAIRTQAHRAIGEQLRQIDWFTGEAST